MIVPKLLQPRPAAEKLDPHDMVKLAKSLDPWKLGLSFWQDLAATAPKWAQRKPKDQYIFDRFTDAMLDSKDETDRKLGLRNKLRYEMLIMMGCPWNLRRTIVLHRWQQAWRLVQAITASRQGLNFMFHSEDQQILMASDEDILSCKVETDLFDRLSNDEQHEFFQMCFKKSL